MNLDKFIQRNGLPDVFSQSAERFYLPFADWLDARVTENHGETYVLGINGAQGTGKSTFARLISEYLANENGRKIVIRSIDDIYLTRGVPGTHDVALGISIIEQLRSLQHGERVDVPRFDKSRDDRHQTGE